MLNVCPLCQRSMKILTKEETVSIIEQLQEILSHKPDLDCCKKSIEWLSSHENEEIVDFMQTKAHDSCVKKWIEKQRLVHGDSWNQVLIALENELSKQPKPFVVYT